MPYARSAGDYARSSFGDYTRRSMRAGGIGSFFRGIVSGVARAGGVITGAARAIGIPGAGIANTATKVLGSLSQKPPVGVIGTGTMPGRPRGRIQVTPMFPSPFDVLRGLKPGMGTVEAGIPGVRRKYRRINPGNAKAATRAIRRVKAARDLLRKIEAQMPTKRCGCGTRAVARKK